MRALGFDVKKADVLKVLKDYDRDGTGKISFQDFTEVSKSLIYVSNAQQRQSKQCVGIITLVGCDLTPCRDAVYVYILKFKAKNLKCMYIYSNQSIYLWILNCN